MASRKTSFNLTFAVAALLLLGIVVFFNGIVGRMDLGRFDLTEDQLYTMSDATAEVLGELDVPVQVKFYINSRDQLPTQLQTLERDVVDKLDEFRVASGGNLSFTVVDPSGDEELQEKLTAKGIRPFQVQSIERDAMGIKVVWSAMTVAYKDKDEEVIPQVLPQSLPTLEYDLVRSITKLTRVRPPKVALYASRQALDPQMVQMYMQMGQEPPQPQEVYTQVTQFLQQEGYEVAPTELSASSPIADDADVLVVLAPRSLSDAQRFLVDRFVQRGGSLFLAAQGHEFSYQPGRTGGFSFAAQQVNPGVGPLLASYGVELSDGILLDTNMETLAIPSTRNVGGLRFQVQEPVQAPMQIAVGPEQMNDEVAITQNLGQLLYLWGSRLLLREGQLQEHDIEATTLFTSSGQAWEVEFTPGPLSPRQLSPEGQDPVGESPLAVLLAGDLPSSFEGRTPPAGALGEDEAAAAADTVSYAAAQSRVVVVGDAKMFEDQMIQAGSNALLLLNVVDALALGDRLIEIRAKAYTQRLLEPVGDQARLLWRLFAIVLVPVLVAGVGITRALRRRREQAAWLASH